MKWVKQIALALAVVLLVGAATSCTALKRTKFENTGKCLSFYYRVQYPYQANIYEWWEYKIKHNGAELVMEYSVPFAGTFTAPLPPGTLEELAELIDQNSIYLWDGFDKSKFTVGMTHVNLLLEVQYEGATLYAEGATGAWPKDFEQGHQALVTFLNTLLINETPAMPIPAEEDIQFIEFGTKNEGTFYLTYADTGEINEVWRYDENNEYKNYWLNDDQRVQLNQFRAQVAEAYNNTLKVGEGSHILGRIHTDTQGGVYYLTDGPGSEKQYNALLDSLYAILKD